MKVWSVILACVIALVSQQVWAKRLGGGASVGKQSSAVAQRGDAKAPTASPAQTTPPAGQAGVASKRPLGTLLAGVAAGLGLAWLASSLGWGEALSSYLLVALALAAVFGLLACVRYVRRRGVAPVNVVYPGSGLAYQVAAPGHAAGVPKDYSPKNVGNDASARPWEHTQNPADHAVQARSGWGVPADFDVQGFLAASKDNFIRLQDAWDRSDIPALRAMMTDDMIAQIQEQLQVRETHTGDASNKTDVLMLEAQLLGIEDLNNEYMASVEFSGMIREDAASGPNPFREVWNITRLKNGQGGWLVAGVQALQ
ncbi:MAG: hypothetical protein RI959_1850 [Pseudomonadota bacterium]|jgi:predicted lipid-binding transport protein (Tim44 family)